MLNLEYRLIARSSQDRSANQRCARTTDKSNQNGWRYSLLSLYNKMKSELTQGQVTTRRNLLNGWEIQKAVEGVIL